ncbi:MAG: CHAD domain-containing protein [Pleurocapsa sp. MO_192.B19]|nr:CHAD domain-containing protein [Pleurocapsa sp. MO_192.B19]
MTEKNNIITLKDLAYGAIAKHSRKIFKYEARVLQDKDPEDLHQMRVGMRRLRSAIACFAVVVDLPEIATEKNIANIGRTLGKLRDLDILLAVLQDDYRPLLPAEEQKSLDKAIKSLNRKRKRELRQVRKTLNGKLYFHLEQGLKGWLDRPIYQKIGDCFVYPLLPDLLLPQVSQLLLHHGWLVGVEIKEGQIEFPQILNREAIELIISREDILLLHGLRKSAKKTRYSLELFARFYGDTYHQYLDRIEQIQEILGQIQDTHVLRKVLEKALKSAIAEQMPKLAELLLKTRYQKWLEWQTLQQQFLDDRIRTEFRQTIIQSEVKTQGF